MSFFFLGEAGRFSALFFFFFLPKSKQKTHPHLQVANGVFALLARRQCRIELRFRRHHDGYPREHQCARGVSPGAEEKAELLRGRENEKSKRRFLFSISFRRNQQRNATVGIFRKGAKRRASSFFFLRIIKHAHEGRVDQVALTHTSQPQQLHRTCSLPEHHQRAAVLSTRHISSGGLLRVSLLDDGEGFCFLAKSKHKGCSPFHPQPRAVPTIDVSSRSQTRRLRRRRSETTL